MTTQAGAAAPRTPNTENVQNLPPQTNGSVLSQALLITASIASVVLAQMTLGTFNTKGELLFFATLLATGTHYLLQQSNKIKNLTQHLGLVNNNSTQHSELLNSEKTKVGRLSRELDAEKASNAKNKSTSKQTYQCLAIRYNDLLNQREDLTSRNKHLQERVCAFDAEKSKLLEQITAGENALNKIYTKHNEYAAPRDPASSAADAAPSRKEQPLKELDPDFEKGSALSTLAYKKDMERRLADSSRKINELDEQILNLVLTHSGEADKQTRAFETQKAGLEAQIAQLKEQQTALLKQHRTELDSTKGNLQRDKSKFEIANRQLQLQIVQFKGQLTELSRNEEVHTAALHEAQADTNAELNTQLKMLKEELDRSKIEKEELASKISHLVTELDLTNAGKIDPEELVRSHELAMAGISAEKENMQTQVDYFEDALAELKSKLAASESEKTALVNENQAILEAAANNDQLVEELAKELETLTSEHASLKGDQTALEEQVGKEQAAGDVVKAEVATLGAARASLNLELAEKKSEIQALETVNATSTQTVISMEAERKILQAAVNRLTADNAKLNADFEAYEAEIAKK